MPHYQRDCSFISIGPAIDPNNDRDDDPFRMTDFILWNVIRFAIDSPQQLALVSKRWNRLVGPQVQLRMMQLLELSTDEQQPIPRDEALPLLKKALSMVCNRSSIVYWSSSTNEEEPATLPAPAEEGNLEINAWPELPPSFQALAASFCFVLCSQSPSPQEVFEFVCEFLDELARETALSMWQTSFSATQKPLTWDEAMPKLRVLAQTRYEFQSTASLVIAICGVLERRLAQDYYEFLQPLETVACKSLRTHLTNLQPSLALFLQISPTTFYNEQPVMLRLASEICSSILSLPSPPAANLSEQSQAHVSTFLSRDESAEFALALPHVAYQLESLEKHIASIETRRLLYSMDGIDGRPPLLWAIPDGAPSLIPKDMLEICAFLYPLSLKGGETIRIRMKAETLENIKRYYQIEGGCPVIEQLPLACVDLQELVPAPYVEFYQSLDHTDIMDLIHGANLLGLVDLVDFGSVCMALFLKGKSADELRAIFGDERHNT